MKRITIIILILFGLKGLSEGQIPEEYLWLAANNNPELKAYFNEYLAALEKVPQAGTLPDPELSIGFFIKPMERVMGNQQADFQLMQMFPWFGTLRTRKDEAGKMAMARYETFRNMKNQIFYQVKSTWYQMYLLEEEIRITEKNMDILKQFERLALIRFQSAGTSSVTGSGNSSQHGQGTETMNQQKVASSSGSSMGNMSGNMNQATSSGSVSGSMGMGSPSMTSAKTGMSDVLRVRININELESTLALLQDSRTPLIAGFNRLLNRDYSEPVSIADTLSERALSIERRALLDSITQNNPMLKMLEAENEAFEAQKKMARLEGLPMLGAGVNYAPFSPRMGNDGTFMGGDDMIMPMIRISIPVYRKKYNAMINEAELKQQSVQQRKVNTVNQLTTQWSAALRDLDDAIRRTTLYREQSVLARQTVSLLLTSYSADGKDFEEVLRVQQQLLDYQLKLIIAIVDQHITLAALEMLADKQLD